MQLIIQKTKEIPVAILSQIMQYSPWDGLKEQLGNIQPTDVRVQCAWHNYAGYIVEDGNLISFAVLAQDDIFNKNIAQAIGYNASTTATMIYLFTTPDYQKQGYAKKLIDGLVGFAKENFAGCEKLVRTTSGEYNKHLYLTYGATLCNRKNSNDFIVSEGLEHDFFFTYQ